MYYTASVSSPNGGRAYLCGRNNHRYDIGFHVLPDLFLLAATANGNTTDFAPLGALVMTNSDAANVADDMALDRFGRTPAPRSIWNGYGAAGRKSAELANIFSSDSDSGDCRSLIDV